MCMNENPNLKIGQTVSIERRNERGIWEGIGNGVITKLTVEGAYIQNRPHDQDKFGPEWFPVDAPRLRVSPTFTPAKEMVQYEG